MYLFRDGYCLIIFKPTTHRLNAGCNKRSSGWGVVLVVPVLRGDDDTVVADVIALVADNEDLRGRNDTKSLIAVSIAKCYNGGDTSGSCG